MPPNEAPHTTERPVGRFIQLLMLLTGPHPTIQEIGERTRAQLLGFVTLILTVMCLGALALRPEAYDDLIPLLFITILAYVLSRTAYYRIGIYFFCFGFTASAYLTLFLGSASSYGSAITTTVHVSLVVASLLLSPPGLVVLVLFVVIASFTGPLYSQVPIAMDSDFYKDTGVAVSIGITLIGASIFRSFTESKRIDQFNRSNRELENLTTNLEERVNERTVELEDVNTQAERRAAQLKVVTELSESIAQLQDLSELFPATTKLISERFGFYHVGIFLIDQDREYAILEAANSEGGKQMLARNHRLKLGVGVVGFCAQTGQPRIALDVGSDAVFFNNPDLPNTRSEVALPMHSRGVTIGVLDVQSTEEGAFSPEDLQVLTALANQVSIAMENTRLLMETRAALMRVQEVYNEFTRTAWSHTITQAEQRGFRFQTGRIEMVEEALQSPEVAYAIQRGESMANQTNGSKDTHATLAVPVKLRGEVIGVLHVESNDPHRNWQNDEISLVQAVAERAAFAMENARLFQDARRRAAKERLISEASARISGALNVENILQATAEELERVLGGSEILIQFQSQEQA